MDTQYTLVFFDTETTGTTKDDRLIQLAYRDHTAPDGELFDEIYSSDVAVGFDAMAIHHITPEMQEGKPHFRQSDDYEPVKTLFESPATIAVAHNAPFDVAMLGHEDISVAQSIDTFKIARFLDPAMKLGRHNLQYLRYRLGIYKEITEPLSAHDAKSDVLVLEKLFWRLYSKMQEADNSMSADAILERMVEISEKPMMIPKFTFGKHKGRLVKEVAEDDKGYLQWLLRQKKESEDDETDWIYTLEQFLLP